MRMRTTIIFIVLFFFANSAVSSKIHDFDVICQIFTEAQNSSFNKEQLNRYIEENVKDRIRSKDVKDAYYSIFHLVPEKRYAIFKQAAELTLKREWDCQAAKKLIQ